MATGAGQGGLGVVHRRARTPLGVIRSVAAGVAVIAGHTASRRNVWTRCEVRRAQNRGAVLVRSAVAGRASTGRRRVVGVVLAARPRRRGHAADGCSQRSGMANIARPRGWNVAVAAPQGGVSRGRCAVVAGRTLASICGNVSVRGTQPTGRRVAGAALGIGEASVVNRVVGVVRLHHHAVAVGAGRGRVGRARAVAAGASQRSLGVIHRGAWTPLRIARRRAAGMAVVAIRTACRQNVRARREIRRTQHRSAVLVATSMTGRTSVCSCSNIRMVGTWRPGAGSTTGDRRGQCSLVAYVT